MYQTHTPSEWAQMVSLAVGAYGALSVPYFVLVDADIDPRPALVRLVESGRVDALLVAVGPVLHDARQLARLSLRDVAVSVAALLAFLLPAAGGTR